MRSFVSLVILERIEAEGVVMIVDTNAEDFISNLLSGYKFPRMQKVRQKFDSACIDDIDSKLSIEFSRPEVMKQLDKIRSGDRVAITAGSRQIANSVAILRFIIKAMKDKGARPFIVPAMGSHGGATAEGQLALLASLGVTEESLGVPVLSDMTTVHIGETVEGHPVYIDKNAAEADHIIVFHRIKMHPCFHGPYESGLMKMMTIGLGKQYGAQICHNEGFGTMSHNIELFGRAILKFAPVVLGIATIENAYDRTYDIKALTPSEIPEEEPRLLAISKEKMGRLLFDSCDVLVVDQIGKNISGSGMDCNVTGRYTTEFASGGIKVQKLAALDLTDESHGNCIGIGMADTTTKRLIGKSCPEYAYVNALTSLVCTGCKIPMVLKNDREAIAACIRMCVGVDRDRIRLIHIRNTLDIGEIEISEAMLDEIAGNPSFEKVGELHEMVFDDEGTLRK